MVILTGFSNTDLNEQLIMSRAYLAKHLLERNLFGKSAIEENGVHFLATDTFDWRKSIKRADK
jgi:hypothetical protein